MSLQKTSIAILITLLLVSAEGVIAQTISGFSRFERQLDAVSWNTRTEFSYQHDRLDLSFDNRLNSRFFIFNQRAQNIQDETNTSLSARYHIHPSFALTTLARNYAFTNTGLRQDQFLAGIWFQPHERVAINPSVGILSDERSNRRDQGLSLSLNTLLKPFHVGETRFEPLFFTEYSDIQPRRIRTTRLGTRSAYNVEDIFEIRSEIWLGSSRRDSYQASSLLNRTESNFIESIESDSTMAQISLRMPVAPGLFANVDASGLNNIRKILNYATDDNPGIALYDSRSIRQFLDVAISLTYPTRHLHLTGGVAWSAQIRQSQLINTEGLPADQVRRRAEILENSNFSQRRFEIFTQNRVQLNSRNLLELSGTTSIMRYDTPELNKDDRDELALTFRMRQRYQYSPALTLSTTLAGEAYHYVYLFAERSVENNWRRSIRLIPEINWQPTPDFYINQQFMVRANYTVEDFEVAGRPKNDQSARELLFITRSNWDFIPGWSLETEVTRSELRIGRLIWKTFQETPIDTLVTWDATGMLTRRYGQISISTGIRYFYKTDFTPRGTVQIEIPENGSITRLNRFAPGRQITVQWGPAVRVRLPMRNQNELFINGWMQRQTSWQRLYITYPEPYALAFRIAERQRTTRLFPNMELTARFRF
jgi:hypothetical protein